MIRQIAKEVKQLSTESLEGIKILLNDADLTDIQATISGPGMLNKDHRNADENILYIALALTNS